LPGFISYFLWVMYYHRESITDPKNAQTTAGSDPRGLPFELIPKIRGLDWLLYRTKFRRVSGPSVGTSWTVSPLRTKLIHSLRFPSFELLLQAFSLAHRTMPFWLVGSLEDPNSVPGAVHRCPPPSASGPIADSGGWWGVWWWRVELKQLQETRIIEDTH